MLLLRPAPCLQACGIGVGLQLLQTSAPHRRQALAEAAGLEDVQPRGLETSTSNLSLLTVRGCGFVAAWQRLSAG